jgi:hypothetical protein
MEEIGKGRGAREEAEEDGRNILKISIFHYSLSVQKTRLKGI